MSQQQFETTVEGGERGRVFVALPFHPKTVWGNQARYYVRGTLNGNGYRGSLGVRQGIYFMPLNKELQQSTGLKVHDPVVVTMELDEPEQLTVPTELAQQLEAVPSAQAFFDGLSAFYRNQYIEWIESAKTDETRTRRIGEVVTAVSSGKKQR